MQAKVLSEIPGQVMSDEEWMQSVTQDELQAVWSAFTEEVTSDRFGKGLPGRPRAQKPERLALWYEATVRRLVRQTNWRCPAIDYSTGLLIEGANGEYPQEVRLAAMKNAKHHVPGVSISVARNAIEARGLRLAGVGQPSREVLRKVNKMLPKVLRDEMDADKPAVTLADHIEMFAEMYRAMVEHLRGEDLTPFVAEWVPAEYHLATTAWVLALNLAHSHGLFDTKHGREKLTVKAAYLAVLEACEADENLPVPSDEIPPSAVLEGPILLQRVATGMTTRDHMEAAKDEFKRGGHIRVVEGGAKIKRPRRKSESVAYVVTSEGHKRGLGGARRGVDGRTDAAYADLR